MPPDERFVSRDVGFSIALPKEASAQFPITLGPADLGMSGKVFQWVTEEVGFSVTYVDHKNPNFNITTDRQYANYFAGVRDGAMRGRNAKILTEAEVEFAGQRGYAFTFLLPEGFKGMGRAFVRGKRGYTLLASFEDDPEDEKLAAKALDSFQLLPGR